MKKPSLAKCEREYDFSLVVGGINDLTSEVEDALFESGCDDATLSIRYGLMYIEFSRKATSIDKAIISAIHDIRMAKIGAVVLRVDECNLVTASEIARRIERTRQQVYQYIKGDRGPGGFPAPEFYLAEGAPLWAWCEVSYWFARNNILRPEVGWNAEVVAAINNSLEAQQYRERNPELFETISRELQTSKNSN
ncbi:MAG: hypothetical protein IT447_13230 [Phycisphaerales bacterium]|jgi:hypothetical protein|nr:hypothetical protein [Phycisphaerales bacterium]